MCQAIKTARAHISSNAPRVTYTWMELASFCTIAALVVCPVQGNPPGDPEAALGARAGLSADARKGPAEPHAPD